jgi:hypothetical protein
MEFLKGSFMTDIGLQQYVNRKLFWYAQKFSEKGLDSWVYAKGIEDF